MTDGEVDGAGRRTGGRLPAERVEKRGEGRDGTLLTTHIEERDSDMYSENMRNIHET